MLDLPVEYLTAIAGMSAALAYVVRAYVADLKETNVYLRDTLGKTLSAQQEVLQEMSRKQDLIANDMDSLRDDRAGS